MGRGVGNRTTRRRQLSIGSALAGPLESGGAGLMPPMVKKASRRGVGSRRGRLARRSGISGEGRGQIDSRGMGGGQDALICSFMRPNDESYASLSSRFQL